MNPSLLRPHMPELNSLRGLACLAVLFFHGLWWYIPASAIGLAGWLRDLTANWHRGVGLFFVLSGMLITNILLESKTRPNYFGRFYKRRALRILPAYYITLILLAIFGVPRAFLGISLLHMANMAPTFGIATGYGPLWTLGVEEQFYLLWPLLVRRFNMRLLAIVAVGVYANSILLVLHLNTNSPHAFMPLWYSAHGLALGALLAIFLRSRNATRERGKELCAALAIAGLGLLWLSGLTWRRPQLPGVLEGMAWDVIFAAFLLLALLVGTSRFEAWTRPKILLFFGEISYGLYLIHVLVFMTYRRIVHPGDDLHSVLTQFWICSLVAVALATVSRFTIEAWFLSLKDTPLWPRKNKVSYGESTSCEVKDAVRS